MRLPPLYELLVASEHGVDHLVQHVLGRLAEELGVRVQRFVVFAVESRSVLHELLAARAWLDQWHGALRSGRNCNARYPSRDAVRDERATRCVTRHRVLQTTSARSRLSGR